jgi:hypothetical protein
MRYHSIYCLHLKVKRKKFKKKKKKKNGRENWMSPIKQKQKNAIIPVVINNMHEVTLSFRKKGS